MLTPHGSVRRAPLLLAALASGIAASESPRIGNSHRNVLLIISDDLRAEIDAPGFGCTAAKCHTPNLKALGSAAGTTVFTRAYVQEALCAPSRNSFLVGRRPDTTKAWQFIDSFREVGPDWLTLPGYFRDVLNYTVVGTGKVFHPNLPPNWDLDKSWDNRMANGEWDGWMYPSEPHCPNKTVWCAVPEPGGPVGVAAFDDTQITQSAIRLLRNITALDRPWFLAVGYRKPHVQWRFPESLLPLVPEASVTVPKHRLFPGGAPAVAFHQPINDFLTPFSDVNETCGGVAAMTPNTSFSDACQKLFRRAYHASVAFMDREVGRLRAELASLNVADRTAIVFFGDHGWQLGEWAEWEKFTNFEFAARVPLIIHAPWVKSPARVSRNLVELVDVMPTTIRLVAPTATLPLGLEGTSLAQIVTGTNTSATKTMALTQFPRCCTAGAPLWEGNDCDDVNRTQFSWMGLSIRTDLYRFTKWYGWNGTTLAVNWDNSSGTELYFHHGDDGLSFDGDFEAVNRASDNLELAKSLEHLLKQAYMASDGVV